MSISSVEVLEQQSNGGASGRTPESAPVCDPSERTGARSSIVYEQHEYKPSHFSMVLAQNNPDTIVVITVKGHDYQVKVNGTDRRRHRLIVSLVDKNDMKKVINRPFTKSERAGLHEVMAMTEGELEALGLMPQSAVFGTRSFNWTSDGKFTVGNASEPVMLHGHVWGVGVPTKEYAPGIALSGPPPTTNLDLKRNKEKWAPNVKARFVAFCKQHMFQ